MTSMTSSSSSQGLPYTTTSQFAYQSRSRQQLAKTTERPKSANSVLGRSSSFRNRGRSPPPPPPLPHSLAKALSASSSMIDLPTEASSPFFFPDPPSSSSSPSSSAADLPVRSTTHSSAPSSPIALNKIMRSKSSRKHKVDVPSSEKPPSLSGPHVARAGSKEEHRSESKERRSLWKFSQRWRRPSSSAGRQATTPKDEDWDNGLGSHRRSGSTPCLPSSPFNASALPSAALAIPSPPPKDAWRPSKIAVTDQDSLALDAARTTLPIAYRFTKKNIIPQTQTKPHKSPSTNSLFVARHQPALPAKTPSFYIEDDCDVEECEELTSSSFTLKHFYGKRPSPARQCEDSDDWRLHDTYKWLGQDPHAYPTPDSSLDLESLASSGWTLDRQEYSA